MELPQVRDRRPLAVQVYDRLAEAVSRVETDEGALPTEQELSSRLGVSRTTVRQALALLEEDGVIERGPRRRRHVAGTVQRPSGTVLPLEEMVRASGTLSVRRLARTVGPATEWSARLLGLARGDEIVTWQSELCVDGRFVANALEFVEAAHEPSAAGADRTLFSALGTRYQRKATIGALRVSPYITDTRITDTRRIAVPRSRLIVLTLASSAPGQPSYLAKHVIDLAEVAIDVLASATGAGAIASPDPEP